MSTTAELISAHLIAIGSLSGAACLGAYKILFDVVQDKTNRKEILSAIGGPEEKSVSALMMRYGRLLETCLRTLQPWFGTSLFNFRSFETTLDIACVYLWLSFIKAGISGTDSPSFLPWIILSISPLIWFFALRARVTRLDGWKQTVARITLCVVAIISLMFSAISSIDAPPPFLAMFFLGCALGAAAAATGRVYRGALLLTAGATPFFRPSLAFLLLAPLINALFGFISWGVTRFLMQKLREDAAQLNGGKLLLHIGLDLLAALLLSFGLFVALFATRPEAFGFDGTDPLGKDFPLLLSVTITLIPTIIHLALALTTAGCAFPLPFKRFIIEQCSRNDDKLDAARAMAVTGLLTFKLCVPTAVVVLLLYGLIFALPLGGGQTLFLWMVTAAKSAALAMFN